MKEKFEFVYESVKSAMNDVRQKKITTDQAKAIASLAKQANNVFASQLDAAKFLANVKESRELLAETGMIEGYEG